MRHFHLLALVAMTAALSLLIGCASQKGGLPNQAPAGSPPAELANAEVDSDPDWQTFLEDDLDDDLDSDADSVRDPIEAFNRLMFNFNDALYTWMLRPVCQGYRKVAPTPVRTGVKNFFHNLAAPIRFANCLLQGKGQAASAEFVKFTINSIFGVLGFGNLTKDYPELNPDSEDLGQTLGSYGIGDGIYIVWPFIGSSTLRDTVGKLGEAPLVPRNYIQPPEASFTALGYETINKLSFRIEDIDIARRATIDPYQAARNYYIKSRRARIMR